ncbi:hypothetical protein FQZ97_1203510 [compost metagenome]
MVVVAPAINSTVADNTRLRPRRSPSAPKKVPPSGRRANATAKTAKVCSKAALGSELEKNCLAMMVARNP